MKTIFLLLIIYQIKHFLADYPLQGRYMLGKFKPYPDYVMPLFCHAGVHALMTFAIALYFRTEHAVVFATFDGAVHFAVDRVKASPSLLGRFQALSKNEMVALMARSHVGNDKLTLQFTPSKEDLKALKSNTLFWWALGADQMAHHLTHYLLIYWMVG